MVSTTNRDSGRVYDLPEQPDSSSRLQQSRDGTLFMSASAAIVAALGMAHLVLTFRRPKLLPRDRALVQAMNGTSPAITRQTTIWCAWLGFNASHSMGAMPFGWSTGSWLSLTRTCSSDPCTSTMYDLDAFIPFVLIPFIGWGVRRHLIARDDWGPLKRICLGIGISAYFVTEMGRSFYRPYVYANDIDDWVVADTIGNSFGTVTAIFMILTMAGRGTRWDWRLVGLVIAGLLGYELLNLTGRHAFDRNDAIATVIFGAGSALVYAFLLARYGEDPSLSP